MNKDEEEKFQTTIRLSIKTRTRIELLKYRFIGMREKMLSNEDVINLALDALGREVSKELLKAPEMGDTVTRESLKD